MRWTTILIGILLLMIIFKIVWPLIVITFIIFLICFVLSTLRQKKLEQNNPSKIHTEYIYRDSTQEIQEAEYIEREAE